MNGHPIKTHKDVIRHLQNFFYVSRHDAQKIVLVKGFGARKNTAMHKVKAPVQITLVKLNGSISYELEPVVRTFVPRTSHYDYARPEDRWTRNKMDIFAILKTLRKTEIWDHIVNRESYLNVNENNTHLKEKIKDVIGEQLKAVI